MFPDFRLGLSMVQYQVAPGLLARGLLFFYLSALAQCTCGSRFSWHSPEDQGSGEHEYLGYEKILLVRCFLATKDYVKYFCSSVNGCEGSRV